MPEELVAVSGETLSLDRTQGSARAQVLRRWVELCLVLLVAFSNPILRSIDLLNFGPEALARDESLRWIAGIVHEATALLLLGYVLARRNLNFSRLGLRWSLRDLGSGAGVTLLSYLAYALGYRVIHSLQLALFPLAHSGPSVHQLFGHPPLVALPYFFMNPFFEELIVRAYLMTEIADLTGSWTLAAVVSIVFQTSYHLYYGWAGALALSFQFCVFALYYAFTRKATPIIFAHGIFDIWGLIRLW